MINLTISTNGMGVRPYVGDPPECHTAEDISCVSYVGGFGNDRRVVSLALTRAQAIELMDDLRSQITYVEADAALMA